MQKAKKRSRGRTKYLIIASTLMLAIVIVTVVVVLNAQPRKWKASEYFNIVAIGAIGWNTTYGSVAVKSLYLNVTPLVGDAHDVFVSYEGASETIENEPYNATVLKGQTWPVELQFSLYVTQVDADGNIVFDGVITIGSNEAMAESMTVKLPVDKLTILPGEPS